MSQDLDVQALSARLKQGESPVLLDVREKWEYDIAALPNAKLVPLGTLQQATPTLDRNADYVVYCHHGGRSAMAAQWLRAQGFAQVANLEGGIDAWSLEIDASVPRY
jgi:rhodanese-related sulfurtransferase